MSASQAFSASGCCLCRCCHHVGGGVAGFSAPSVCLSVGLSSALVAVQVARVAYPGWVLQERSGSLGAPLSWQPPCSWFVMRLVLWSMSLAASLVAQPGIHTLSGGRRPNFSSSYPQCPLGASSCAMLGTAYVLAGAIWRSSLYSMRPVSESHPLAALLRLVVGAVVCVGGWSSFCCRGLHRCGSVARFSLSTAPDDACCPSREFHRCPHRRMRFKAAWCFVIVVFSRAHKLRWGCRVVVSRLGLPFVPACCDVVGCCVPALVVAGPN